jgi:hypothetical protein
MKNKLLYICSLLLLSVNLSNAQQSNDSSTKMSHYKNVVRYDLSGALIFGIAKYVVFGYERVISPHQSLSLNVGKISLPKIVSIVTDSFSSEKDIKRGGFNISVDYRFYLAKENKFNAPHGLYIGPYYSYNHFTAETQWTINKQGTNEFVDSHRDFTVHSIGFELGYQFILWKRLTLDLVMIGPGVGFYKYKVTTDNDLDPATKEQLMQAIEQLLTQKFPGMNYVFSDKHFDVDGVIKTSSIGYRYIVHIGFTF